MELRTLLRRRLPEFDTFGVSALVKQVTPQSILCARHSGFRISGAIMSKKEYVPPHIVSVHAHADIPVKDSSCTL